MADKTEEELLQEWQDMEASAGQDDGPSTGQPERILDQNEIDSLLGTDDDDERTGVRILVDSNIVNYEKLPMLEVVFDKFERFLSTSLRHFTADNVEVTLINMTSVRFGDYLNNVALPAGIQVVKAEGLDDYVLLVYQSQLIYSVVDILLGGRKSRPSRVGDRSFTTIERSILDNMTEVVLNDLTEAFSSVSPVAFKAERMEVNPRFAMITRENNAAILVTIRINLEEREGTLQFCLPYATLEPVRDQLLQQFVGEKLGQDNIWENHLAQELFSTGVKMQAVLDEFPISLSDVMKWKIGDTLPLSTKSDSIIELALGGHSKLRGTMGRVMDQKAIMVQENVNDVNNEES